MPVPLVEVERFGVVESVHLGDIAVCDASGALIASVGDPGRVAFARSCMKPLQGAVSLASIEGPITDRDVAVMCSSHNGEAVHVRAVRSLLKRGGLDEEVLRNPPGRPIDPEAAWRTPRAGGWGGGRAGGAGGRRGAGARAPGPRRAASWAAPPPAGPPPSTDRLPTPPAVAFCPGPAAPRIGTAHSLPPVTC